MLRGLKKDNYHKFSYYLRECDESRGGCGELFKAKTRKSRFCINCKEKINQMKIIKSLEARGVSIINLRINIREVKNVNNKLDSQSIKPI